MVLQTKKYRGHVSLLQLLKTLGLTLIALGASTWYGYPLVQAVKFGAVLSLRNQSPLIYLANDPAWFSLNVGLRVILTLLFATLAMLAIWRQFREQLRDF